MNQLEQGQRPTAPEDEPQINNFDLPLAFRSFLILLETDPELIALSEEENASTFNILCGPELYLGERINLVLELGRALEEYELEHWNGLIQNVGKIEPEEIAEPRRDALTQLPPFLQRQNTVGRTLADHLSYCYAETVQRLAYESYRKADGPPPQTIAVGPATKIAVFSLFADSEPDKILALFPDPDGGQLSVERLEARFQK